MLDIEFMDDLDLNPSIRTDDVDFCTHFEIEDKNGYSSSLHAVTSAFGLAFISSATNNVIFFLLGPKTSCAFLEITYKGNLPCISIVDASETLLLSNSRSSLLSISSFAHIEFRRLLL